MDLSPLAWWDCSADGALTTTVDGVTAIADQSGNSRPLARHASSYPQETTVNGLAAVDVNNTDGLTFDALGVDLCGFVFVVDIDPASQYIMLRGDPPSTAAPWVFAANDGQGSSVIHNDAGSPTFRLNGSAFAGSTRDDLYDAMVAAGPVVVVTIESIASTAANGWSFTTWSLFGYTGGWQFDGDLCECVAVASLTTDDRTALESHLMTKWGAS